MSGKPVSRRSFCAGTLSAALLNASGCSAPVISFADRRPLITHGVQSGDVMNGSAVVWSRTDRAAFMHVELSTTDSFRAKQALVPILATEQTGFASKATLTGLPAGEEIFYRIRYSATDNSKALSEAVTGRFRSAPKPDQSIRFAWSGDTAGQGWGIDRSRGGMLTYNAMLKHKPDFFIHSGDTIYADNPIALEQAMPDGNVWRNLVVDGVHKVAESLDEFRGRWRYNLLDENVRAFNARIPVLYHWDDHEVIDNWSPSKNLLDDSRYTEKSVSVLAERSLRAFHEMLPIRPNVSNPGRIFRSTSYGSLLDVFSLDLRSYRGPNAGDPERGSRNLLLGGLQTKWLTTVLRESAATWKIVACSQPLGLTIWDDWRARTGTEGVSDGDSSPPRGREMEIAELLGSLRDSNVKNVVWLCADVHYTAAHHYHPDRAVFKNFDPFWEFVSGPLHAGTFAQSPLDATFGPEVKFVKGALLSQGVNLPPSEGLQFFGLVDIDGVTSTLTVRLMDNQDNELYCNTLEPASGSSNT